MRSLSASHVTIVAVGLSAVEKSASYLTVMIRITYLDLECYRG